jgi:hypothetical protein
MTPRRSQGARHLIEADHGDRGKRIHEGRDLAYPIPRYDYHSEHLVVGFGAKRRLRNETSEALVIIEQLRSADTSEDDPHRYQPTTPGSPRARPRVVQDCEKLR